MIWRKSLCLFLLCGHESTPNLKGGQGNESRDLFQDYDLFVSDHNRYPVTAVVEPG